MIWVEAFINIIKDIVTSRYYWVVHRFEDRFECKMQPLRDEIKRNNLFIEINRNNNISDTELKTIHEENTQIWKEIDKNIEIHRRRMFFLRILFGIVALAAGLLMFLILLVIIAGLFSIASCIKSS